MKDLFNPRAVAVVGASDDQAKHGGRVTRHLIECGFPGPIYPVNPSRKMVLGLPAYTSVNDLPDGVEHVAFSVPAEAVLEPLRQVAERGVRYATVFGTGFAESGTEEGRILQDKLVAICRETGIRVLGPNCGGFVSLINKVALGATIVLDDPTLLPGRVGVVSQSGGLGLVSLLWKARQLGLGLSHLVTCGNCAVLDAMDYVDFMIDDADTTVICLILEAIGDGPKFIKTMQRAAERGKPVIVLKVGRTEHGSRMAASHTGAITGSDDINAAVFRQLGLIRVYDTLQMCELAMLLQQQRLPASNRVSAISISGGSLGLLTDIACAHGLEFPPLSEATTATLAAMLPADIKITNPLDFSGGNASMEMLSDVLAVLARDDSVSALLPLLTFHKAPFMEYFRTVVEGIDKPVAVVWTGGSNDAGYDVSWLVRAGISAYPEITAGVLALAGAVEYRASLPRARSQMATGAPAIDPQRAARATALMTSRMPGAAMLGHLQTHELLALYDLPVLKSAAASSADLAVEAARSIGYPVVMKIDSPEIAHKTEVGGVLLDLLDETQVREAYVAMLASVRSKAPGASITGVIIEQTGGQGVECLLGLVNDATFGPVITMGLGGVHTELLRDVVHFLPTRDADEIARLLATLRGYPLLTGYRGQPAADIDALCATVVKLGSMANEIGASVSEIDLNPVLVRPAGQGVALLDALVVCRTAESPPLAAPVSASPPSASTTSASTTSASRH